MQPEVKLIEEYASLFLTIDEIAIMLKLNTEELRREIRGKKTDRAQAYHRGKLTTKIELRKQTLELARAGSPQAESAMIEFSRQQQTAEHG